MPEGITENIHKVAQILVAMGTQNAAQVMKSMNENDIERITIAIANIQDIPAEILAVLKDKTIEEVISLAKERPEDTARLLRNWLIKV